MKLILNAVAAFATLHDISIFLTRKFLSDEFSTESKWMLKIENFFAKNFMIFFFMKILKEMKN